MLLKKLMFFFNNRPKIKELLSLADCIKGDFSCKIHVFSCLMHFVVDFETLGGQKILI